ncbi:MAG: hypothetical protein KZQ84_20155, partial [Candidatus Thiodiazotropha sp. (ex Lucinoma borealis)]|nr:hypothetical protein [Candidatus Thiodiazotropha sp. (ex Lucinoma borealis)]
SGARHDGSTVSPHGYRGLTASAFSLPWRSAEDGRATLRAGKVGFVFQSFQLLSGMTALENVMLPLELAGHDSPEQAAKEALSQAGLARRLHGPSSKHPIWRSTTD